MGVSFKLGRRVDDPKNHNWQEIDFEDYRVIKPVVLVLGGLGTNSGKDTNGYLKIIKSLLGVFNNDVDLLGVCYKDSYFQESNIAKVVLDFFLPLVTDKDGKRLSFKEACKNMRKITIFAHCFGVQVSNQITERLMDEMEYLKYSEEETTKILQQVFMVGFASYMENRKFKSVNIISPYDPFFNNGKANWEDVLYELDKIDMSPEDRKYMSDIFKQVDENESLYFADEKLKEFYANKSRCLVIPNLDGEQQSINLVCSKLYKSDSDHHVTGMAREIDWQSHEFATKTGDCVSECISSALCNSVANSVVNEMQEKLVEIDMKNVQKQLEEVVKPLNEDRVNTFDKVNIRDK
ncbi:MAG: hypothetical protein K2K31_01940 [Clostridia bacterium]|nr:hypothetical protein [Clostridia bacterium]